MKYRIVASAVVVVVLVVLWVLFAGPPQGRPSADDAAAEVQN